MTIEAPAVEKIKTTPEIAIPKEVFADLQQGTNRILETLAGPDRPQLVIVLARAGTLVWDSVETAAEERKQILPPVAHIRLSRKIMDGYGRSANLMIGFTPRATIVDYKDWLVQQPESQELINQVKREISTATEGKELQSIKVVDDTLDTGATLCITAPIIITEALKQAGQDVETAEPTSQVGEGLRKTIDSISKGNNKTEGITLSANAIIENRNWMRVITEESFGEDLKMLELDEINLDNVYFFLTELMKGVAKANNGEQPPDQWQKAIQIGERIAEEQRQIQWGPNRERVEILNPAKILETVYSKESLLNLAKEFEEKLKTAGRQIGKVVTPNQPAAPNSSSDKI